MRGERYTGWRKGRKEERTGRGMERGTAGRLEEIKGETMEGGEEGCRVCVGVTTTTVLSSVAVATRPFSTLLVADQRRDFVNTKLNSLNLFEILKHHNHVHMSPVT